MVDGPGSSGQCKKVTVAEPQDFEVVSKNVENMSRVREKLVAESREFSARPFFFLAAFGEKSKWRNVPK
jgi:hypothetical protein